MRKTLAVLVAAILLAVPNLVLGQGAQVYQNGTVVPGHLAKWFTNGRIGDVGDLTGDASGAGLTPFGVTDKNGLGICLNSAITTGAYNAFCFGHDQNSNALITVDSYNGLPNKSVKVRINGTTYDFPGAGNGNMLAPTSPPPKAGDMVIWNTDGSSTTQNGGRAPIMVSRFGGDMLGNSDSSAALNACLAAAKGGVCHVDDGGKLKLATGILIPAQTTLDCGWSSSFKDSSDADVANYPQVPALRLAQTATIVATGQGAGINHCLIYRDGMAFPANPATFAGVGVSDGGWSSFSITDTMIMGFATCLTGTGPRPWHKRVYMDCQNQGGGAAYDFDNGNTDGGYIEDIRILSFSTGLGGSCTAKRKGIGFRFRGIDRISGLNVVLGYDTDYYFNGGLILADGATIWADYPAPSDCGANTATGMIFATGTSIIGGSLNINGLNTGVRFLAGSPLIGSRLDSIFLNLIGGNGVVLGDTGISGGNVSVGFLSTNPANEAGNVGGYAIVLADTTSATGFHVHDALLGGVHGGVAPFIFTASPNRIGVQLEIDKLLTTLPLGTSPYGGFSVGHGSERSTRFIFPTLDSCTGLGSGSCALTPDSDVNSGIVTLSPAGGPAASGSFTLTFPFVATARPCQFTLSGGSAMWDVAATAPRATNASGVYVIAAWNNAAGALAAGQTYGIAYHCPPQ